MKPRKIKDLYLIILDTIENKKHEYANYSGICRISMELLDDGVLTTDEYWKFIRHLRKNRPTVRNKFKSFYEETDLYQANNVYWWGWMCDSPRYIDVRIRFLKAVIATLK